MSMYDRVFLESEVSLPYFPDSLFSTDLEWQTKTIGRPSLQSYRITNEGRLLQKEKKWRDKTDEEKQKEAETYGVESWEKLQELQDKANKNNVPVSKYLEVPDPFPMFIREEVNHDEEWIDCDMHGSFEFHTSGRNSEGWPDIYFSYEARFTEGDLDKIIFIGGRNGTSREEAIQILENID